jgi:hypothetical protein
VQPIFIAAIFKPLYQMDNSLSFIIKVANYYGVWLYSTYLTQRKTDIENHDRSNMKLEEKNKFITPESKNKTPKLNYREAAKYYQGIKTQNKAFGKRKR